jgi:pilus assembly protein CpaF
MAYLEIKNGADIKKVELNGQPVVLGKDPATATIVLADPAVSRRHAEIIKHNGAFVVHDLGSSNHTFVNKEIVERAVLRDQDLIMIRPFEIIFRENDAMPGPSIDPPVKNDTVGASSQQTDGLFEVKKRIHREFIKRMDLKKINFDQLDQDELKGRVQITISRLLQESKSEIPREVTISAFEKELLDDILGLGPIEDMINDAGISEIMVNNKDQIYYEKGGKIYCSEKRFYDDQQVLHVIERIISATGKSINESSPIVDTRLVRDGSRVNAIIPPLAVKGPCLTIRKFSKKMLTPNNLVQFGSLSQPMVDFLKICVEQRKNIIVSGGTGSGKTTLLNILSSFIPSTERIVSVEDAAEVQLQQDHVITLEARSANLEGKGAVTIRDLVRNCLRMRPDRIIVGECRGPEALDMLQAMNTGHDGSLTTVHANSPRDAVIRLETMVLMTGMDLPLRAIRNQIESAVDIIIQQTRFPDGSRKVTYVTEITGMENDIITTQDIFVFEQKGYDQNGKVMGAYKATAVIPSFYDDLKRRGLNLDYSIFRNQ